MLVHIVLFKLPHSTPELLDEVVAKLRDMRPQIKEILHFEVGINIVHSERAFDFGLYSHFASLETMEVYQKHPVHQAIVVYLKSLGVTSVSLDYTHST